MAVLVIPQEIPQLAAISVEGGFPPLFFWKSPPRVYFNPNRSFPLRANKDGSKGSNLQSALL